MSATGFVVAQISLNFIRRIGRTFCIQNVVMFLIPDACESQPYVLQLPDKGSFVDISFLKENSSQSSNFCLK